MNVENVTQITSLIFAVVGFVYGVYQTVSKSKVKTISKEQLIRLNELELSIDKFDTIKPEIMKFIVEAEASQVSGVIKKMLVKSRLTSLCLLKSINATDSEIDYIIEEFITFSKQVNSIKPNEVHKDNEAFKQDNQVLSPSHVNNTGYGQF